jgi:cell division septal protein FtsQ
MSEFNTASVKTVSNAIKRKRKNKRVNRFKKFMKRLFILILLLSVGFGLYKLDESKIFRLSAISVSNNTLYSNEEIIEVLDINVNDRMWLIYNWFYRNTFNEVNGVEAVKLTKKNKVLLVSVTESHPVGVVASDYLLANGKLTPISEFNKHYQVQLPEITGFNEDDLQVRLAQSMAILKPEILLLIGEVQQITTSYDSAQIRLLLHDKKQVYSDFRSLVLLNDYPLFVDKIGAAENCIYLDFTSRTARSAPCE